MSSWVSSAAIVVSSTTASTVTSVHQRPLPCRHYRFRFSDQTTDYTIGKKSLRSAFLWNIVFIRPSTCLHAPPEVSASLARAFMRCQYSPRACTRHGSFADVSLRWRHLPRNRYVICWRHLPRHLLTSSLTFDSWLFLRVDFFSLGSSYPVFRVDFIFAVCFCILYL